jgi:hypothetical protein
MNFYSYLSGKDLRSIGKSSELIKVVTTQNDFDNLFSYLRSSERIIAMRAADVIEKITANKPEFLFPYSKEIIELAQLNCEKEFKWHIAQIISRLKLNSRQKTKVSNILFNWVENSNESKFVRVNSLQSLFEICKGDDKLIEKFSEVIEQLKKEKIPSLTARINKLMSAPSREPVKPTI